MLTPDLRGGGATYEHTYGRWLEFFRNVAAQPRVTVGGVPTSWVPFLAYLGADVTSARVHFAVDELWSWPSVQAAVVAAQGTGLLRELVEVFSVLRPELADALYKSDVLWQVPGRRHTAQRNFNVTCLGAFSRPEVLDYIDVLRAWQPPGNVSDRVAVLVPCAADKPYPAPLHRDVLEVIGARTDVDLYVVTGVLGLIPQALWSVAPVYDSGIPNMERVGEETFRFFSRNVYRKIAIYSDFYGYTISRALRDAGARDGLDYEWVCFDEVAFQYQQLKAASPRAQHLVYEYIDLRAPANLARLRAYLETV